MDIVILWIAEKFYYIWAFAIVSLALHWRINLAMCLCLFAVCIMLVRPIFFSNPEYETTKAKSITVSTQEKEIKEGEFTG